MGYGIFADLMIKEMKDISRKYREKSAKYSILDKVKTFLTKQKDHVRGLYAVKEILSGQGLSTSCSSSLQYVSAVLGSHSLTETVFLLSLLNLGLECHLHLCTPPYHIEFLGHPNDVHT